MKNHRFWIFLLLSAAGFVAHAQQFMIQPWTWEYAPYSNSKFYAQRMADRAGYLHEKGFTHLWAPPLSRGSSGTNSMGYDPYDLYDLGDNNVRVRLGRRNHIQQMFDSCAAHQIDILGDLVMNHRNGGRPEDNGAVQGWITNYTAGKLAQGDQPFPSDRFRCYLTLGGADGITAGTYYFKFRSASLSSIFHNKQYRVMMSTKRKPATGAAMQQETEPNGGGDCAQSNDTITLGRLMQCNIDAIGCGVDEFMVKLDTADFFAAGDTLFITMANTPGGLGNYSDHYLYSIWSGPAGADIKSKVKFQTYTDFSYAASGRGKMNHLDFKPNGAPTNLGGDWDGMWFFYDYDQNRPATRDSLFAWAKWMYETVGIKGMRLDAIKHFPPAFVGDLLDYLHQNGIDPSLVVGEYFDYSPATLKNWIDAVLAAMEPDTKKKVFPRVFDFPLRGALKSACISANFDVRNVFNSGLVDAGGVSGFDVVTFLDNHDTDHMGEEVKIANNPQLAYAYLLTNNQLGIPCIFETHYYGTEANTKEHIRGSLNALMAAHKQYIFGSSERDYLNRNGSFYSGAYTSGSADRSMIYQMRKTTSGKDVVVAINFGDTPLKVFHSINTADAPIGTKFTDIYRVSSSVTTTVGNDSRISIEVPAKSFGIWVEGDNLPQIPLNDTALVVTSMAGEVAANPLRVAVYPNPAQDNVTVHIENATDFPADARVFILTDMLGREVLRQPIVEEATISLAHLPEGVYLWQCAGNTGKLAVIQ